MTLIHMIKLALAQMGEDSGANEIDEFRTLLTAYINEAYMEICQEKKQKFRQEGLLFSNGRAAISALARDAVRVLEVKNESECPLCFEVAADQIFIDHQDDVSCVVSYLYLPPLLSSDLDEPDMTERECHLLVDYATYRGLGLGDKDRQKRAEFFLMRYLSGYSALGSRHTRILNKYS